MERCALLDGGDIYLRLKEDRTFSFMESLRIRPCSLWEKEPSHIEVGYIEILR